MKSKSTAKKQPITMKDLPAKKIPTGGGVPVGSSNTTKTSTINKPSGIPDRWGN